MTPPPRVACALALFTAVALSTDAQSGSVESYREIAQKIIIESTRNDAFAWNRLAEMTDTFGHRLSGSPGLEAALRWSAEELKVSVATLLVAEPAKLVAMTKYSPWLPAPAAGMFNTEFVAPAIAFPLCDH